MVVDKIRFQDFARQPFLLGEESRDGTLSRSYSWSEKRDIVLLRSCEIDRGQKLTKFRLEARFTLSFLLLTFILNISRFASYRSLVASNRYTHSARQVPTGSPCYRRPTTFDQSSLNKTNKQQTDSLVSLSASTALLPLSANPFTPVQVITEELSLFATM
jgi:hypothetical protein